MDFTLEQTKIVYSNSRINVALSTPGSGKSTVIVGRASRIWLETQEPILICTFSNKTTEDIKQKLESVQGHIDVKTIHSLCYKVVRENWALLGDTLGAPNWPEEATLVTKDAELDLYTKEFLPALKMEPIKFYDTVQKFRKLGLSPGVYQNLIRQGVFFFGVNQRIEKAIPAYERMRLERGYITYDDMIGLCNYIISSPEVSIPLSRRYMHIMIDEAQDTSESQWDILRPLVNNSVSTLCVGDLNQSLYSWRCADGSVLNNLSRHKEAVVFRLSKSFRTAEQIADFANIVVHNKTSQIDTDRFGGDLFVKKFGSEEREVEYVLKHCPADGAILARTNSYLEPFEKKLIEAKSNYLGSSFYRSAPVLEVFDFIEDYEGLITPTLLKKVFIKSNAYSEEEKDDFKQIIEKVDSYGVDVFLNLVKKAKDLNGKGITLLTGHGAKGLEWNSVFVVGCHSGLVPHKLSNNYAEERNIFYVMTTRARDLLSISYLNSPSPFIPKEYL
jgi:DNA helicase-2/ATP-dependent DNA helicase PcrA